jgi:hypothetical protein
VIDPADHSLSAAPWSLMCRAVGCDCAPITRQLQIAVKELGAAARKATGTSGVRTQPSSLTLGSQGASESSKYQCAGYVVELLSELSKVIAARGTEGQSASALVRSLGSAVLAKPREPPRLFLSCSNRLCAPLEAKMRGGKQTGKASLRHDKPWHACVGDAAATQCCKPPKGFQAADYAPGAEIQLAPLLSEVQDVYHASWHKVVVDGRRWEGHLFVSQVGLPAVFHDAHGGGRRVLNEGTAKQLLAAPKSAHVDEAPSLLRCTADDADATTLAALLALQACCAPGRPGTGRIARRCLVVAITHHLPKGVGLPGWAEALDTSGFVPFVELPLLLGDATFDWRVFDATECTWTQSRSGLDAVRAGTAGLSEGAVTALTVRHTLKHPDGGERPLHQRTHTMFLRAATAPQPSTKPKKPKAAEVPAAQPAEAHGGLVFDGTFAYTRARPRTLALA